MTKSVTIQSFKPGPQESPPSEPPPHVAQMVTHMPGYKGNVWKVTEPDIDELMTWLPQALKERWPRLSEHSLAHWFRAASADRKTLFIRTEHVVGMFELRQDILEPNTRIYERFIRHKEGMRGEELQEFMLYVRDYGLKVDAQEFSFNIDTDCWQQTKTWAVGHMKDLAKGVRVESESYYRLRFKEFDRRGSYERDK